MILMPMLLSSQEFIKIMRPDINIRMFPSISSTIVGHAFSGEVYKKMGENDQWYQVALPSGENRWIYKKLAQLVHYQCVFENIDYKLIKNELLDSKNQALITSRVEKIENLNINQIEQVLIDRGALIVLQKHNIDPCCHQLIMNYQVNVDSARQNIVDEFVSVSHIDYDLFKIDFENYYIETRRCFKLGSSLDAFISIYYEGDELFKKLCFEDGYGTDFENCYNIKNIYHSVINEPGLISLTQDGKLKKTELVLKKTTLDRLSID